MSLTRIIKTRFQLIIEPSGRLLANAGVTPNFLTSLGLVLALIAGFLFATRPTQPYLGAFAVIGSGIMDILDGAVARETRKFSGSLNDSIIDRTSEIAIYGGIIYADYVSPFLVLLALGFSFLTSYIAAKGESLGIPMSGHLGIAQRAERLTPLIVFALIGYVWIGVYINLVLCVFTFAQRYMYVIHFTSSKKIPLA